jgi:hypothetical protein
MEMTTQQAVGPAIRPAAESTPRSVVPWLIGAIVALAIAVVALGAMLIAPSLTTPPEQAMVDDNIAAWNTPAAHKLMRYYADDATVVVSSESSPAASGMDEIINLARYGEFTVERLGPVGVRGNLVWYLAHVSTSYDVSGSDAVVVYYMRDGKVAQHWVIWDEL